jgi:hypothetical protein
MNRAIIISAFTAMLVAALPLHAQLSIPGVVTVEGFVTQYWLDDPSPAGRIGVCGGGARVMFSMGGSSDAEGFWTRRPAAGAFLVVTSEQEGISTFHVGGELDMHLFRGPLRGILDPFVSIGLGAFRLSADEDVIGIPLDDRASTELTAVPGAGVDLRLTPRFAVRGDLRDIVIFGPETTHNFEASAGLAISF